MILFNITKWLMKLIKSNGQNNWGYSHRIISFIQKVIWESLTVYRVQISLIRGREEFFLCCSNMELISQRMLKKLSHSILSKLNCTCLNRLYLGLLGSSGTSFNTKRLQPKAVTTIFSNKVFDELKPIYRIY